jgi:hypothetical protein
MKSETPHDSVENVARKYLADRGVQWETFTAQGGEISFGAETDLISRRLNLNFDRVRLSEEWNSVEVTLWFRTYDGQGGGLSWIARPIPQIYERIKFVNPQGERSPIWIPAETWEVAKDVTVPITVTEGPVKGLVLVQAGAHPIALSGVYNLAKPKKREVQWVPENDDDKEPEPVDEKAKLRLRDELLPPSFNWLNRKVYLCFDMDSRTKPEVRRAEIRAWLLFEAQGAQVFKLEWPA